MSIPRFHPRVPQLQQRKHGGRKHTPLKVQMFELMMFRPRYCCQGQLTHKENKNEHRNA
jgi:hypothetical protein